MSFHEFKTFNKQPRVSFHCHFITHAFSVLQNHQISSTQACYFINLPPGAPALFISHLRVNILINGLRKTGNLSSQQNVYFWRQASSSKPTTQDTKLSVEDFGKNHEGPRSHWLSQEPKGGGGWSSLRPAPTLSTPRPPRRSGHSNPLFGPPVHPLQFHPFNPFLSLSLAPIIKPNTPLIQSSVNSLAIPHKTFIKPLYCTNGALLLL